MKAFRLAAYIIVVVAYCAAIGSIVILSKTITIHSAKGVLYASGFLISATLVAIPVALWERKLSERAKTLFIPVSGTSDQIRLLAYDNIGAPKRYRNLSRCTDSGEVVWTADLPQMPEQFADAYVSAEVEDQIVVAYTFHGFRSMIDINTGKVLTAVFTK